MANFSTKYIIPLVAWTLTTPLLPPAWGAENLNSIRIGEQALAYSSGSIQQSTPQDGFVNVITGDNQTTGDHMILGSRDVLYLRLNNPGDIALGDLFTIYRRAHKVFHPTTGRDHYFVAVSRVNYVLENIPLHQAEGTCGEF